MTINSKCQKRHSGVSERIKDLYEKHKGVIISNNKIKVKDIQFLIDFGNLIKELKSALPNKDFLNLMEALCPELISSRRQLITSISDFKEILSDALKEYTPEEQLSAARILQYIKEASEPMKSPKSPSNPPRVYPITPLPLITGASIQTGNSLTHDPQNTEESAQDLLLPVSTENISRFQELISDLKEGISQYHKNRFKYLEIARRNGLRLLELKSMIKYGFFQKEIATRFPDVSYGTHLRWMQIAENETKVDQAIKDFPDVKWGIVPMLDYLDGKWNPAIRITTPNESPADSIVSGDACEIENDVRYYPVGKEEFALDKIIPPKQKLPKKQASKATIDSPTNDFHISICLEGILTASLGQEQIENALEMPSNWKLVFKPDPDSTFTIRNIDQSSIRPAGHK